MSEFVQLAAFVDRAEAVIAQGVLEANGVEVLAPELYTLAADPGLVFALGGYRLLVRQDQLEAARELLAQIGAAFAWRLPAEFPGDESADADNRHRRPKHD